MTKNDPENFFESGTSIEDLIKVLDINDPFKSLAFPDDKGIFSEVNIIPGTHKAECKKFLLVDLRYNYDDALAYLVQSYDCIKRCSGKFDNHYTIYFIEKLENEEYIFFTRIVAGLKRFKSQIRFKVNGHRGLVQI